MSDFQYNQFLLYRSLKQGIPCVSTTVFYSNLISLRCTNEVKENLTIELNKNTFT